MLAVEAAEEAVMVIKPENVTLSGVMVDVELSVLVLMAACVLLEEASILVDEAAAGEDFEGAALEVGVVAGAEEDEEAGQRVVTRPLSRSFRRRLSGETKACLHERIVSCENDVSASWHSALQGVLALKEAASGQAAISLL